MCVWKLVLCGRLHACLLAAVVGQAEQSLRDNDSMLLLAMTPSHTALCFIVFTDCLTNDSEALSNNTEYFLSLFNKTLACFEHNLQVSYINFVQ